MDSENITYKVERTVAILSDSPKYRKLLTLTSWNGQPAKVDVRTWKAGFESGTWIPGKGITLSAEEAQALLEGLKKI